jgi:acyl carrier protein
MTQEEILELFTRLLRDLLADDSIVLAMDTRRTEIPAWDSFNYINFIAAAEMELKIRFNIAEVESFENVGAIVRRAAALQPPKP